MMAALLAPLTACAAPSPLRESVSNEDDFARMCQRLQDVRKIILLNVFQEFARPDQVAWSVRNIRTIAKIMLNNMIGNDAVLNSLPTAIDSQRFAAQVVKEPSGMPLAATDIQHRLNL